jgi:hypothetical protein
METVSFEPVFQQVLNREGADEPWSKIEEVLATIDCGAPRSELAIEKRWHLTTALQDFWAIEVGKVNDSRLYH